MPAVTECVQMLPQPRCWAQITRIHSIKAVRAFEDARGTRHSGFGEPRREQPRMSRPASVQGFHCRTLVHELHDAAGLTPGNAQCTCHLLAVKSQQEAGSECACQGSARRGELESVLGEGTRRD